MVSIIRDLIEYSGIDDCLPLDPKDFKQITVDDDAEVPIQKPSIDEIVKVYASAEITYYKDINTPKGLSLEGLILTGHKLVVQGIIKYKIQYSAQTNYNSVYSFHHSTPFMTIIILPEDFKTLTFLKVSTFIEDVYMEKINCREVYLNTTLLLTAESC